MAVLRTTSVLAAALTVAVLCGCPGSPPPADQDSSAESSGEQTSTPSETSIGTTSETTTTESTSTTDPSTSSSSDTSVGTTPTETSQTESSDGSTGSTECGRQFVKIIELVENATIVDPMQTAMSQFGEGLVAFSSVAEQGSAEFAVDVPCSDTFRLWGRTLDASAGTGPDDPDSYYVAVDGAPEDLWFYGCHTINAQNQTYGWYPVDDNGFPCDAAETLMIDLDPGAHLITVRNREAEAQGGGVAVIARILLTNDETYIPTDME